MSSDLQPEVAVVTLGSLLGSDQTELPVFSARTKTRILGIDLLNAANISAHTSNYGVATVYRKGTGGTGTTVVAQRNSTADSVTGYVPWPVTLSTTIANRELNANEVLTLKWTENGLGQDLSNAKVAVHYAQGYGGGI